jgi:LCP family protein required for cell wall assembly
MCVNQAENKTPKKQWNRRKSVIALSLLLLVAATASALAHWRAGALFASGRPGNSPVTSPIAKEGEEKENVMSPPHKLNIMLLGVDERPKEDDPGRSDTLLVMMVDARTREISILSVPRDTRVWVKDLGWDKINHAYAVGGVSASKQATEEFLGIRVDYYAKVDLASFGRIVDALGGLNLDVEKRMQYVDSWDHYVIDLKPGVQRLDGRAALQYVRYRDEEGDIGRVRRQQKFLKAMLAEMTTATLILKLPDIIREVIASLDTDLPIPLMLAIANQLKKDLSVEIKTNIVEGLPYYINDISYWVPDVMKTRHKVSEMQGFAFSGNIHSAAVKKADEYRRNLPTHAYLDDGTDYSGKDSSRQVKPKLPVTSEFKPPMAVEPKITPAPAQTTAQTKTAPAKTMTKVTPSVLRQKDAK